MYTCTCTHADNLTRTTTIPSNYVAYCDDASCESFRHARVTNGYSSHFGVATHLRPGWRMSKVSSMLAEELGVSVDELVRAANQSVWGQCKSTPLILVWLAKPFFVLRTMREFPNVNEFAYADAGQWPVSGTAPPSLGGGCLPP